MRVHPTQEEGGRLNLRGHCLVVPGCGGLAHLGELCVDALVSTFGLRRVAVVQSRHILPVAMASAWDAPGAQDTELRLTTAAEIYQAAAVPHLSVLQLRSPVVDGRRRAFAAELWAWACAEGVAELVIVASCSSHVKEDADLAVNTELRYVHLSAATASAVDLQLGHDVLPLGHSLPKELLEGRSRGHAAVQRSLRGSGLAGPLLLLAAEASELGGPAGETGNPQDTPGSPSVLCLIGLTSEILNWHVVNQLARAACAYIGAHSAAVAAPSFRPPPSWQYRMEIAASPQQLWG